MQELNDTESKFHKVSSETYSRKKTNINNITNTSNWSDDEWDEFEDTFNDNK